MRSSCTVEKRRREGREARECGGESVRAHVKTCCRARREESLRGEESSCLGFGEFEERSRVGFGEFESRVRRVRGTFEGSREDFEEGCLRMKIGGRRTWDYA